MGCKRARLARWAVMAAVWACGAGCQRPQLQPQRPPQAAGGAAAAGQAPAAAAMSPLVQGMDPLAVFAAADRQRMAEVQLVEQMAQYRNEYEQYLQRLIEFYDAQGSQMKATWARREWEHVRLGPRNEYLAVAELAGPQLRAGTSVAEADALYEQALELKRVGAGAGKAFVDKKRLYGAIERFNEVISKYPMSDKIDDAAFQVGEIYDQYLEDGLRGLLYYQRAWQWDPQTPWPVRFMTAKIYDEKLHDRVQAINFYRQALNVESQYSANATYARNRIERLGQELQGK